MFNTASTRNSKSRCSRVRRHRFHFSARRTDPMSASTATGVPPAHHDKYGIGVVDAGGHRRGAAEGRSRPDREPSSARTGGAAPWARHRRPPRAGGPCISIPRRWRKGAPISGRRVSRLHVRGSGVRGPWSDRFEAAFRYAMPRAEAGTTMPCETASLSLVARRASIDACPRRAHGPTPVSGARQESKSIPRRRPRSSARRGVRLEPISLSACSRASRPRAARLYPPATNRVAHRSSAPARLPRSRPPPASTTRAT